ncbi:hypothetical protein FA95DRAFT_1562007 [Auriscalpium vulgare]|uniref:Uncharacterized protein n=1 Tax=Auriscalpium vulgare TaxID=40419 RepID=A0ACB8RKD8_9AGAM|nr:hypothetical protein FA95DRAFT_1562007 [Auriscalpium vulgare]
MFAGAFGDKPGVPLDPLAIPGAHGMYAQDVSPASFAPDASSGPPSPHAGPFTPTTLETIQMPADAWQQHTGLGLAPPPPSSADSSALPHTLEYQPYAWQPNMWTHGGEPLFNEDFDLSLIPPIALDVPKFDVVGERDHDATPTGGCAPQFAACDGDDGGRDPFMQGFRFDDHLMSGDGF